MENLTVAQLKGWLAHQGAPVSVDRKVRFLLTCNRLLYEVFLLHVLRYSEMG